MARTITIHFGTANVKRMESSLTASSVAVIRVDNMCDGSRQADACGHRHKSQAAAWRCAQAAARGMDFRARSAFVRVVPFDQLDSGRATAPARESMWLVFVCPGFEDHMDALKLCGWRVP